MDRMWQVFVLLAVIAAAGACGDDGGSGDGGSLSATDWTHEVCQVQSDFETAITNAVTEEQAAIAAAGADLEAQKQAVITLLDVTLTETDAATERIDELGPPDADGADAALEAATDRFAAVRGILADARTQAEALPTGDPAAFTAASETIAASIGTGFQGLASSFPDVGSSEELRDALAAEPLCGGG